MSKKSKTDIILESLVGVEERVRKLEDDINGVKKALKILLWIAKAIGIAVGIIAGMLKIFSFAKGQKGKKV